MGTSSCASLHNSNNIDLTSYAMSKSSLDHLVKLLAAKFAPWYVRVDLINPGFIPSNMNPVEEGSNQFTTLFGKMPAKRIAKMENIVGRFFGYVAKLGATSMVYVSVWMGKILAGKLSIECNRTLSARARSRILQF